jgi:hypothetical protein
MKRAVGREGEVRNRADDEETVSKRRMRKSDQKPDEYEQAPR